MTRQMEALLILAYEPAIRTILLPVIDRENETVHWDQLNVGVLSGGQKAAISWAVCIWSDAQIPDDKYGDEVVNIMDANYRDPFEGFGVMDRELQIAVLKALAHRHGVFDEPSALERHLRNLSPALVDYGKKLDRDPGK